MSTVDVEITIQRRGGKAVRSAISQPRAFPESPD